MLVAAIVYLRLAVARWAPRDDRGFVTAENLGVAAFGVIALSAIFVALKAFGLDVIHWIASQTGISSS